MKCDVMNKFIALNLSQQRDSKALFKDWFSSLFLMICPVQCVTTDGKFKAIN